MKWTLQTLTILLTSLALAGCPSKTAAKKGDGHDHAKTHHDGDGHADHKSEAKTHSKTDGHKSH